ncbi:penicillin acylase family protein [bacterium AH-315-J21]|nr:penicillin acylase family protein [bacterium AH-315-J21]
MNISESITKSITKRNVLLLIFTVAFSAVGGAVWFFYSSVQDSLPQVSGSVSLADAEKPIEITFDSLGVPQIWAESERDALFALGYQHAADRLFQMDIVRHVSQGRLSELLGSVTIDIDILQRKMRHKYLAKDALTRLDAHDKELFEAYAAGVNSYVGSCAELPFEYLLLRSEFAEWSVYDCLTALSFQTWFSDAIQNRDKFFVLLAENVGIKKAKTLALPYPDWGLYTVPTDKILGEFKSSDSDDDSGELGGDYSDGAGDVFVNHEAFEATSLSLAELSLTDFRSRVAKEVVANNCYGLSMSAGSNGWVVSSEKSSSGGALLAGDPHLDVTRLPQFWYLVGIHSKDGELDALGITVPGLPFFVMGHNRQAAWTMTAAGIDQTDYYFEEIDPNDSLRYRTADGWREFEIVTETLMVAGEDSALIVSIKNTAHGPMMFENIDSLEHAYSYHWAGFDIDLTEAAHSALQIAKTQGFAEFRKVVTRFGALNANWMFADTAGNIGYQLGAPIPVRSGAGVGDNFALNGWDGESTWKGFRSFEETPASYNPAQGWLANCNNKQDQPNLGYPLTGSFFSDRILRATEVLSAKDKYSLEDMRELQLDRRDRYFMRWQSELTVLLHNRDEDSLAELMRNWDGVTDSLSVPTAIIAEFILQLKHSIFEDELGQSISRLKRLWVDQIYHQDSSVWFDNINTKDTIEDRTAITKQALAVTLGKVAGKNWGQLHSLVMRHPMSIVPVVNGALGLTRGPWSRGGSGGSINASYYRTDTSGAFHTLAAPSWRFLIDMSDPTHSLMCLPAGVSGNPISEHFFDFNSMWVTGAYHKLSLDYSETKKKSESVLTLAPN